MNEHDYEPLPGLPAPLPKGETILWQGAPGWKSFARRAMRVRVVAGYFVLLAIWGATGPVSSKSGFEQIGLLCLEIGALAAAAIAILGLFAWLVAKTTLYTVTTRRVVMRFGIALPITVQISFPVIDSAAAHIWSDGSGDIALNLLAGERIAYLVIWPHARPWKLTRAQPSLRSIPDAAAVAQIIGRALALSASQPARTVSISVTGAQGADARVPAAA